MKANEQYIRCLQSIPSLMKELLAHRENIARDFVALFKERKIRKIYFSGQASGIYIGMMLKRFIEDHFDIEVQITNPSAFIVNERFNVNQIYTPKQLCMLCPAHSGSTINPIKMAELCRKMGIAVVTTTYDLHSPLAMLSDVVIDKRSGAEASYGETKGHFASLMCFYICFIEAGIQLNKLTKDQQDTYYAQLATIADHLPLIMEDTMRWYQKHQACLIEAPLIRYVANCEYEGAALEGGLKLAETHHSACVYYEMEEFMHRSTTQIDSNSVIFLLACENKCFKRMLQLQKWCRQYTEKVFMVGSKAHFDNNHDLGIHSDDVPYFSVMEYLLPYEVLVYLLAESTGQSLLHARNDGSGAYLNTHLE